MNSIEENITHIMKNMNKLPLPQKMAKETKMRKLQHKVIVSHTQQKHHVEKVKEMQDEAKSVTGIIKPVNEKVHEGA